jgi:hypothetical protein
MRGRPSSTRRLISSTSGSARSAARIAASKAGVAARPKPPPSPAARRRSPPRSARSAPTPAAVFDDLARRLLSLRLLRQTLKSLETAWLAGQIRPSELRSRVRAAHAAEEQLNRIVQMGRAGKVKGWQASRAAAITTAQGWADAITQLLDMRNVFERIYRGEATYRLPAVDGKSARRSIQAICERADPCLPPCRPKRRLFGGKRCVGPAAR